MLVKSVNTNLNRLERAQKQCLKMMYGYSFSYRELLEKSGLETLKERRENAMLKFAKKAAKNPLYKHLFPLNECERVNREQKTYKEELARTDRLYNSPVFAMRRALNNTPTNDRVNDPRLIDLSHLFNDPF